MADRTGQQLGNYRLRRLLDAGGFAEVYLGEHIHLRTQAAIKVLYTQLTSEDVERFLNEARMVARLIHPHIVRVLEFGIEGKTPFFVMDYAINGSLRQRHYKGSRLPLVTVISYVWQLAEALQYAHSEKVIHRDVKPENMLVGRHGEILLSDFGIAIVAQSSRYHNTQDMAGTIAYMAPEQIHSHARAASDQYSLAITVYEWLTGDRPFHGSFTEIAVKQSVAPPPSLRTRVPGLSLEMERVVMTALSKEPKDRFPSVQAFAQALEQASKVAAAPIRSFEQSLPVGKPFEPSSSQPFAWEGARSPSDMARLQRQQAAQFAVGQPLTIFRGHLAPVYALAWSPDGTRIASAGGGRWLCIWETASGKQLKESSSYRGSIQALAWSPDGAYIVVGGQDKSLMVLDTGTFTEKICKEHKAPVNTLACSPDGLCVASGSDDGFVHIWDRYTWKPIFSYRQHKNDASKVFALAWSPRGEYIVSGGENARVQVWQPGSGNAKYVYQGHSGSVYAAQWAPGGEYIASGGNGGVVRVWRALSGDKVCWYSGHSVRVETLAWSPDGSYIASGDSAGALHIWNALSGQLIYAYSGHKSGVRTLAWSPNGAYLASAGEDQTVQIWKAP